MECYILSRLYSCILFQALLHIGIGRDALILHTIWRINRQYRIGTLAPRPACSGSLATRGSSNIPQASSNASNYLRRVSTIHRWTISELMTMIGHGCNVNTDLTLRLRQRHPVLTQVKDLVNDPLVPALLEKIHTDSAAELLDVRDLLYSTRPFFHSRNFMSV